MDTSALLDCWRRHYPPDTFPGLWAQLDALIATGQLAATEEVLHELERKDDELYEWVSAREGMFVPIDDDIQIEVSEILEHHPKLIDERRNRSGADPFVIALAKVEGCAVLTGERPNNSAARPHIPDVCLALGIEYTNMVGLLRREGWSF